MSAAQEDTGKAAGLIDAHVHVGPPARYFAPRTSLEDLLRTMDRVGIAHAVGCDHTSVYEGFGDGLARHRELFERSSGRFHFLGVFDPRRSSECLAALDEAVTCPGFVGLKIHPSLHGTPAEDASYDPAWRFTAEHDKAILAHSWSVSDYNPVQALSTPFRFEAHVKRFPEVRFVLGHFGGCGTGRHEAVKMVNDYANVYGDFAGDIFDYRLIAGLLESVPAEKILFGSDYPWIDPRANLTLVLLADVDEDVKAKVLGGNARKVYFRREA